MNILVIGNGFDLAHGLPTKYRNFLDLVERFRAIMINPHILKSGGLNNTAKPIYAYLDRLIFQETNLCMEFQRCTDGNFWIYYFLECPMYQKENWIDFEHEISNVIQSIDMDMKKSGAKIDDYAYVVNNQLLKKFFAQRLPVALSDSSQNGRKITYREIRDILYKDLNNLIRAFEIYLSDYVEEIEVKNKLEKIETLEIDHVLSFNYSHTYQKYYGKSKKIYYDYIHGETQMNNMVLGIDEYLGKKSKNQETDFIVFKKYFQRIYKETGSEYKNWIDEIKSSGYVKKSILCEQYPNQVPFEEFTLKHNVYIFGHSLDITDKDVLRELILNDNVYTTIFYLNKDVMGQQITNLVKVIGQEELLKRTGGSTKTIEFVRQ